MSSQVLRPVVQWSFDMPPPGVKVVALTRYGIMIVGPITKLEWESGYVVWCVGTTAHANCRLGYSPRGSPRATQPRKEMRCLWTTS